MNWFNTLSALIYYLLTIQTNGVSAQFMQNIHSVNITRTDNLNSGDKVNLVVVNSTRCQDINATNTELSAQCTLLSQGTVEFGENSCYIECVCKNETGSFIVNEKKCGDERRLRQGCSLVFGSWSWTEGWRWNSESDRLSALYIEDGFGIQGAFNVSKEDYEECRHTSLSTYDATGMWNIFTAPANESSVTFFEIRNYWHLNWIIEDISESRKSEIEGKFIKLDVTCENSNEVNGIVEVTQLSSCLVFKVTGNVSHEYTLTSTSTIVHPSTSIIPAITTTDIFIPSTSEHLEYPSTTIIPVITTTDIPILSTSEHIESSVTIQETTSAFVIPYITPTSSQSNPVIMSSSVTESSPVIITSPLLESSQVIISSPMLESSPVIQSSSVIESNPVIESSSVILSTPVIINSPIINSSPVTKSSSVIDVNPVIQSSSMININPVKTNSSIVNSVTQSTQASPKRNEDQIGLIIGIVVAGSAAVVIAIAAIVLTATSVYNSYVKRTRTQIIQNDATNISLAMDSFDKILPTHI